ncbi:MAG: MFS transporter [Flavobacteriaceae bacterium]
MSRTNQKKIVNAWAFYDWANSVYPLVISTAIFPIFYMALFVESDYIELMGFSFKNTALIQFLTSFVFFFLAILVPIMSGIADFLSNKKSFMKFFVLTGSFSCIGLYFFDLENIYLGIFFYTFALFSFWASLVFYNSYLPDIVNPEDQDKASALGYSYGYVGSVLLLLLNIFMINFPETFGFENSNEGKIQAMRVSFLTVGFWWLIFSQYTFYYLPKSNKKVDRKLIFKKSIFFGGFDELLIVWKLLKKDKGVKKFLIAFFTFSTAVQTIILIATYFGEQEINWAEGEKTSGLILSMLLIQLIAIIGSVGGAYVSKIIGNVNTLIIFNISWFSICIIAYFIESTTEFYIVAGLVGLVMGGIQSLSRSTYSKLIPETENTCSYFSFYQMCMILSIVLGTFMSGAIDQITGNIRYSILLFALLFLLGSFLLRNLKVN